MVFRRFIVVFSLTFITYISSIYDLYYSHADHYRNQVAVLTYHHIDPKESAYTISPQKFREHLEALQSQHYHVISMEDFIAFLQGKQSVPPNAVVITFDDGYESFYRYAYPELKKRGMTATNFLIVGDIDTNNTRPSFLKWSEIIEMRHAGFSFYSHTYRSHNDKVVPLTRRIFLKDKNRLETEEEYRSRIKNDLTKAERILREKLGNRLSLLCFPHGKFNKTVIDLGQQAGIQYFFTGEEGLNSKGDKVIKRIDAGDPWMSAERLVHKLNKEATIRGKLENAIKKLAPKWRNDADTMG